MSSRPMSSLSKIEYILLTHHFVTDGAFENTHLVPNERLLLFRNLTPSRALAFALHKSHYEHTARSDDISKFNIVVPIEQCMILYVDQSSIQKMGLREGKRDFSNCRGEGGEAVV